MLSGAYVGNADWNTAGYTPMVFEGFNRGYADFLSENP